MSRFKITITETLSREVILEAENKYEALRKIRDSYAYEAIILDDSDFQGVEFEAEEFSS